MICGKIWIIALWKHWSRKEIMKMVAVVYKSDHPKPSLKEPNEYRNFSLINNHHWICVSLNDTHTELGQNSNLQPSAFVVLKSKHNTPRVKILNIPWQGSKSYILFSDTQEGQKEIRFGICNKKEISFFFICSLSSVFKKRKLSPFLIFSFRALLAIC